MSSLNSKRKTAIVIVKILFINIHHMLFDNNNSVQLNYDKIIYLSKKNLVVLTLKTTLLFLKEDDNDKAIFL